MVNGAGGGRNALHLWKLLRPNFSVKCVIYGRPYYLRSCPVHDTVHPRPFHPVAIPATVSTPAQPTPAVLFLKITLNSASQAKKFINRCPRATTMINVLLTAD